MPFATDPRCPRSFSCSRTTGMVAWAATFRTSAGLVRGHPRSYVGLCRVSSARNPSGQCATGRHRRERGPPCTPPLLRGRFAGASRYHFLVLRAVPLLVHAAALSLSMEIPGSRPPTPQRGASRTRRWVRRWPAGLVLLYALCARCLERLRSGVARRPSASLRAGSIHRGPEELPLAVVLPAARAGARPPVCTVVTSRGPGAFRCRHERRRQLGHPPLSPPGMATPAVGTLRLQPDPWPVGPAPCRGCPCANARRRGRCKALHWIGNLRLPTEHPRRSRRCAPCRTVARRSTVLAHRLVHRHP